MKTLTLLLLGLLLAGCPKTGSTGTDPEPTPPPRTEQAPEPTPKPTPESRPSTDGSSRRVIWAIVARADGSEAELPEGLTSAQASRDGSLQVVHGSPRAMPQRGDWSTLAMLGDESAKNKVAGLGGLMGAVQGGEVTGYLKLGEGAPDDPKVALTELGAVVNTVAGDVLTVKIPAERLGDVLGAGWVVSLEVAGTVRPRKP